MQPAVDMSREQFFQFCQPNRDVRIERNAEGSIAVMAPTGGETTHAFGLEWNTSDPVEVRRRIRAGQYHGQTGGLAKGYVQANIAMLPVAYADEFARFCQRNPKPCPVLAMSEPGSPRLPELAEETLAEDLDGRSHRPPELSGLPQRRARRRCREHRRALAGRFRGVRARLLLLVRGGPGRCRSRSGRHRNDGSVCPMYLTVLQAAGGTAGWRGVSD